MKVLHLIYDVEVEPLIQGILHRGMIIPRYTRFNEVMGARAIALEEQSEYATEPKNRMVLVIAPAPVMDRLVVELKQLRARLKHGIRGYVSSAEQII